MTPQAVTVVCSGETDSLFVLQPQTDQSYKILKVWGTDEATAEVLEEEPIPSIILSSINPTQSTLGFYCKQ
jgi:hypothetical protein